MYNFAVAGEQLAPLGFGFGFPDLSFGLMYAKDLNEISAIKMNKNKFFMFPVFLF
jgi:hypothetical protein